VQSFSVHGTNVLSSLVILKSLCLLRIDDELNMQLQVLDRTVKGSEKPANLKFQLLQLITNKFCDEQSIGHGASGVVYKVTN